MARPRQASLCCSDARSAQEVAATPRSIMVNRHLQATSCGLRPPGQLVVRATHPAKIFASNEGDAVLSEEKSTALVLIPARNEAASIGQVVRGCRGAGFSVTVIDDASTDATPLLAAQAGADVLTLPGPQHGKTAALHHALTRLPDSAEWLFFLDGDGQHHPGDIDRFWQLRAQADLIVGNRFPDAARMPIPRRWTNRVMSTFLHRSGIVDSQCGFRLVRRAWLGNWLPVGHHFQFETEMELLAAGRPGRIVNLPIPATYAREESKIVPWRDALNFARCLLRSNGGQ
jgi:glycosyltransferase involved in cell wall biosynthesis